MDNLHKHVPVSAFIALTRFTFKLSHPRFILSEKNYGTEFESNGPHCDSTAVSYGSSRTALQEFDVAPATVYLIQKPNKK